MVIGCNSSSTLVTICDGNELANGIEKPLISQETTGNHPNNSADRAMYLGINEHGQEEVVVLHSGIATRTFLAGLRTKFNNLCMAKNSSCKRFSCHLHDIGMIVVWLLLIHCYFLVV